MLPNPDWYIAVVCEITFFPTQPIQTCNKQEQEPKLFWLWHSILCSCRNSSLFLQNNMFLFFFNCFISDLGEEKWFFLIIYSFRWLKESEASRNTLRTAVTLWVGDLAFLKNDANVMIIHEAQTKERFRNTIQWIFQKLLQIANVLVAQICTSGPLHFILLC